MLLPLAPSPRSIVRYTVLLLCLYFSSSCTIQFTFHHETSSHSLRQRNRSSCPALAASRPIACWSRHRQQSSSYYQHNMLPSLACIRKLAEHHA